MLHPRFFFAFAFFFRARPEAFPALVAICLRSSAESLAARFLAPLRPSAAKYALSSFSSIGRMVTGAFVLNLAVKFILMSVAVKFIMFTSVNRACGLAH